MHIAETMSQTAGTTYLEGLTQNLTTPDNANTETTSTEGASFHSTLQEMVHDIDLMQKQLTESITHLTRDPDPITSKMQTAGNSYDIMMGIKSRLKTAYEAIAQGET